MKSKYVGLNRNHLRKMSHYARYIFGYNCMLSFHDLRTHTIDDIGEYS